MEPKTIRINEVDYVRKDSISPPSGDIKIVVLDRGFVYVGHVTLDAEFVTIQHAKNIRIWGTTQGLGQLTKGPLSSTKLDNVGTVKAPIRALISLIDVDQTPWLSC